MISIKCLLFEMMSPFDCLQSRSYTVFLLPSGISHDVYDSYSSEVWTEACALGTRYHVSTHLSTRSAPACLVS